MKKISAKEVEELSKKYKSFGLTTTYRIYSADNNKYEIDQRINEKDNPYFNMYLWMGACEYYLINNNIIKSKNSRGTSYFKLVM